MDRMDFTMDNPQASHQQPTAQFQCQNQHAGPLHSLDNGGNRPSSFRENQHYDPVHESSTWYQQQQPSSTSSQHRTSYTTPQNLAPPPWGSQPFGPPSNWSTPGDTQSGGRPQDTMSTYRAPQLQHFPGQGNSMVEERNAFRVSPSGYGAAYYNPYNPVGGTGNSEQPNGSQFDLNSNRPQTTYPMMQRRDWIQAEAERQALNRRAYETTQAAYPNRRPVIEPSSRVPSLSTANSRTYPRPGSARTIESAGQSHLERAILSQTMTRIDRHERGLWSSDEDDPLAEGVAGSYARSAELMFSPDDTERAMAAMRGALSVGKRVPSKEAIASLIPMTVEQLTAENQDLSCMICYNEFGVANPEGTVETPLRLPKCKHVFGSICIKKWFEDKDSCPYCRDKLPSQLRVKKNSTLETYRLARERERQFIVHGRHNHAAESIDRYNNIAISQNADGMFPPSQRDHGSGFASSVGEISPDRRRQSRGRMSSSRPTPNFLRPSNRGEINGTGAHHEQRLASLTQRRSTPASLPNPFGMSFTSSRNNRFSISGSPTSPRRSDDDASPAVAVGSFIHPSSHHQQHAAESSSSAAWSFRMYSPPEPRSTDTPHPTRDPPNY